ncbi:MAG: DUF3786 domain-containing protein [Bacillota bacterium]
MMCNVLNAYAEAAQKLAILPPEDAAARSGAVYDREKGIFLFPYFGREYEIDRNGRIFCAGQNNVPYNDRVIMVQYLCLASGLPPRGRWLSFLELPDGSHHYAPFQTDATNPLAKRFGRDPDGFQRAARTLGGTPLEMGDLGFKIPALPKLPLAVILWEGDEEFSAQTNILFDAVAPTHLSTATLWVLGVELARKMLAVK